MLIRVRGWHTVQKKMYSPKEMAEDQLTLLPTGQFINVHGSSTRFSVIYPTDLFVPMLSTGLTDKNGKEIFKGDILQSRSNYTNLETGEPTGKVSIKTYQVVYIDAEARFGLQQADGHTEKFQMRQEIISQYYEVIGNIYEDIELLG